MPNAGLKLCDEILVLGNTGKGAGRRILIERLLRRTVYRSEILFD